MYFHSLISIMLVFKKAVDFFCAAPYGPKMVPLTACAAVWQAGSLGCYFLACNLRLPTMNIQGFMRISGCSEISFVASVFRGIKIMSTLTCLRKCFLLLDFTAGIVTIKSPDHNGSPDVTSGLTVLRPDVTLAETTANNVASGRNLMRCIK